MEISEKTLFSLIHHAVSMTAEIAKAPDPQMLALLLSENQKQETRILRQSLEARDSL